jgi:hypothetical protein
MGVAGSQVLYPNDFEWSQKGRICLKMPPERITFELYPERSPLAVENFIALIKGNKGIGDSGRPLHYKVIYTSYIPRIYL